MRRGARAVVGAFQFRKWAEESFKTLAIATQSAYVVEGATKWMGEWQDNDWLTSHGSPPANVDLWEELLRLLNECRKGGTQVYFWQRTENDPFFSGKVAKRLKLPAPEKWVVLQDS